MKTPQLFINDTGTPPHYLTSAAELFYLNHLRSCAATASGSHCTSSAVRSGTCESAIAVIVEFLTAMCMILCRNMLMLLNVIMDVVTGFFTEVLQSIVSPLEVSACIVLAGAGEPECHRGQLILAAVVLCLASCDWHVPLIVPYHKYACAASNIAYPDLLGICRSNIWKKTADSN